MVAGGRRRVTIGLVRMAVAASGPPAFTPADLGAKVVLWFSGDTDAELFTDTAGTTPANPGDAVARVNDKAGANHATQATAGKRPLRDAGGYLHLSNDWLQSAATGLPADSDIFMVGRRDGVGNNTLALSQAQDTFANWLFYYDASGDPAGSSGAGTPANAINGAAGGNWPGLVNVIAEATAANLSAWASFGFGNYTGYAGLTHLRELIVVSGLTPEEDASLREWLDRQVKYDVVYAAVGDSITSGEAGGATVFVPAVGASLSDDTYIGNFGDAGSSWDYDWSGTPHVGTAITDVPTVAAVLDIPARTYKMTAFAGTNDFCFRDPAITPAQSYADFETWLGLTLAEGWSVGNIVVVTMLPRTDLNEVTRSTYNALLVAGAATHGYRLARVDLDPTIGVAGANLDTDLYLDGTHPTTAGHAIIASIVAAAFT